MKKYFIVIMLMFICFASFGQDTTSVSINYVNGESILQFLSDNWIAVILLSYAVLSDVLGESKATDVNSVFGIIKKMLGAFAKK